MSFSKQILPKPIQGALSRDRVFIDALFKRPRSLAALLPYESYDEAARIFLNKDGSLGVVFELEFFEHEVMTGSQIVEAVSSLKSWFSLPGNCTLQILFEQSYLSEWDKDFSVMEQAFPDGHRVSSLLFNERMKVLKSACRERGAMAPFIRKGFVAIRFFPEAGADRTTMFQNPESTLHGETVRSIRALNEFKHVIADFEHNAGGRLTRLTGAELVDILRRFFNPKSFYEQKLPAFNPSARICDQIIFNQPRLDHAGLEVEGVKTRTISLKTSPQYAYPGGMAYFTRLPFPFRLSLAFSFPSKAKVKQFFDVKEFFLQNTPSARARRQREEVLEVQDRLARDDRCLHMTFNVIVDGTSDEELEQKSREVISIFHHDLECGVVREADIGLGLCLNSLPLCYAPKSDLSSQRFIRILRSDAMKFIPIFDSFRGLEKPLQVYLSRERNLAKFSLLENETSNHTVVLADSGSGKSAFVIDCIQAVKRLSPEPLVFVIDKKSSYQMVSEYFDADLTVFDWNAEMPFSPFRGQLNDGKVAFLTQLIGTAIKLTSPSFQFESDHMAAVTACLRLAHDRKSKQAGVIYEDGELKQADIHGDVEITMDDVVLELAGLSSLPGFESFGQVAEDLSQKLKPFYGDGAYAKFFGGAKQSKEKSKLFYVYDLDALDSDPVLRTLMTMAVMDEITRIIKLPEHQGRMGMIVLEELGRLGKDNPIVARYVVDWAETLRKLGYWLIGIAPRPQNFFELEAGRALWGTADNFLFLQMSADNVNYLMEKSDILDEASAEIVKSLRTVKGKSVDVFYVNKKKTRQGAFMFFQTALDRWLAPTNAQDGLAAKAALRMYPDDKWRALRHLTHSAALDGAPAAHSS